MRAKLAVVLVTIAAVFAMPTTASAYLNVDNARQECQGNVGPAPVSTIARDAANAWLHNNGWYMGAPNIQWSTYPPVSAGDGVAYRRWGPRSVQVMVAFYSGPYRYGVYGSYGMARAICHVTGDNNNPGVNANVYWQYLGPSQPGWPSW